MISARISHASSARVKTSLRIFRVFETSKSLQRNRYRPSLRNVKDLACEFNIPEGLRISATVGVVERSQPTPLIHRRGLASLSIVEPIAVKPLCQRADQFRAAVDSLSKSRPLTFQAAVNSLSKSRPITFQAAVNPLLQNRPLTYKSCCRLPIEESSTYLQSRGPSTVESIASISTKDEVKLLSG